MSKRGAAFIIIAACLWGTAGFFVRSLNFYGFGQMQIVFARSLFTVIIMGTVCLIKDRSFFRVRLKDLWLFAENGIVSIVFFTYCYYKTISLSTLSVAAVLMYTAPFFVMILAIPIFKERLTVKKCIACVTAFIGCCFVSGVIGSPQSIGIKCLIYGLLTGLGYSFYTIFGNLLLNRKYSSLTVVFYSFCFATAGSAVLLLSGSEAKLPQLNAVSVAMAVGMAVVNTVLPYILYTAGLKLVDAGYAPIIATVEPVMATVLGIFYKDYLDIYGVIGVVLVVGSVVILNLRTGKSSESKG